MEAGAEAVGAGRGWAAEGRAWGEVAGRGLAAEERGLGEAAGRG